jgi:Cutinase
MRRFGLVLSVLAMVVVAISGVAPAVAASFPAAQQASLSGPHAKPAPGPKRQAGASASGCPDVLFVGARGSGESSTDHSGYGADVYDVLQKIETDLGAQRTFQATPVTYHAYSVWKLLTDPAAYFQDLGAGVNWTMKYLAQQAQACPDQQIVLAGFSQGAMVMHRVLHKLSNTAADQPILSRVAAAVLIGDGDQVPFDREVRDGSAWSSDEGVGLSLPLLSHSSSAKFNSSLGTVVLRVCNRGDIVCDYQTALALNGLVGGVHIHLSYAGSKPLLQAADRAASNLLALRYPGGTLNVSATVGTPLSASATVIGGVLPVTVFVGPDGTAPSWLGLGATGGPFTTVTMSGTPTAPGSWGFDIVVEDSSGSEISIPVNLTVASNSGQLAAGDLLAGESTGTVNHYGSDGTLLGSISAGTTWETGACEDASGNVYQTNFDDGTITQIAPDGTVQASTWASGLSSPESCAVAPNGDVLVGQEGGDVVALDSSGSVVATYPVGGRSDWISLGSDNCTLNVAIESGSITQYNICTNSSVGSLTTSSGQAFQSEPLPNGDLLVAAGADVEEINSSGVVHTYSVPGSSVLFSLAIAGDGNSFWVGDLYSGQISRVSISTGDVLQTLTQTGAGGLLIYR